jgi:hypothetical protein
MLSQLSSLEIVTKVDKTKERNSNKFFWQTAGKLQSSTEELQANYRDYVNWPGLRRTTQVVP